MPILTFAQIDIGTVQSPPLATGVPTTNPVSGVMKNIINYVVWPIAVGVVIVLFIMAGMIFLTAQGEPGKIETARKAVTWGVVGVIIILISFSIIATVKWLIGL